MERRPHVLTEHEIQIFDRSLEESLAADPASDEMNEGVSSAEFSGNSLRRRADCVAIPQINRGREEPIRREVQLASQRIQFILTVIEQSQCMSTRRKRLGGLRSQRARCPGDHDCLIH